MATISQTQPTSHRKLIDIPEETFHVLSLRAVAMGTNLKKLIEDILVREADTIDDAELYRHLVATRPQGKVMLTPSEQSDFERQMRISASR